MREVMLAVAASVYMTMLVPAVLRIMEVLNKRTWKNHIDLKE